MTITPRPTPKSGVLTISPYVGGKAHAAAGVAHPVKLSSNESALGPSPKAMAAFTEAATGLAIYPDGHARILRAAIAESQGLEFDRIICGNGSDEILQMLCNAYLQPGDETVMSQYAFSIYEIYTRANDATPVVVPAKDLGCDIDAMLAAVTEKTKIVFLANPNNPTGTCLSEAEVNRLHAGLPENVLLVLDSAYAEFVTREDYEPGLKLAQSAGNVVMTRTFSKIYALAGLRIGWGYASAAVLDVLNRIRPPFNVSVPAQAAGAAAIRDVAHLEASRSHNTKWRAWLTDEIRKTGILCDDSAANFLLLRFPHAPGKTAAEADIFLNQKGLILRAVTSYGLPDALRLTIGREDANRRVIAALTEFMS